ncbi:unnamed protein product [Effrenium voratum]|nr:unnamed protein product [Effrenium voratum]|mmetsp:Transcript_61215/g.145857  ORF Transcript_61215/g.145857 Transcript_61215/m.145857 type:complete len:435 (-) Transcript_61215:220-1524(-)
MASDSKKEGVSAKAQAWKPFPWNYLPNKVALIWGSAEVAFISPLFAVLIGVNVAWFNACMYVWRHPKFARCSSAMPELIRSVSRPLGRIMLQDPRNHSYLPWLALMCTSTPLLFFYAMYRHHHYGLEFSTLVMYHVCRGGPRFRFFGHAHTLVHKEGHAHTGHFKKPFQILNYLCEWWLGPFYGVVPNSYSVAHMKIHHRWHNDVDDVHTNLDLDRTKLSSFFVYVPRFSLYWMGISPVAFLAKRGEWYLVRKLLYGMSAYYGVTLLMLLWNPVFCIVYWIFAHLEGMILLCAISYLWHAFVEESDPGNQYVNSVTILDGHDNTFNEDYHVVHHHSPSTHWTDAPAHFEKHKHEYAAVTATIFQDTEEGALLQMLFENDWDSMARHFVDLNGKLSHEEKKALLVRRLKYTVGQDGRDGKRMEWGSSETIRDYDD